MEYYISTVIITQLSLLTLNVLISKKQGLIKTQEKGHNYRFIIGNDLFACRIFRSVD